VTCSGTVKYPINTNLRKCRSDSDCRSGWDVGTQTNEISELCTVLECSNASRNAARYDYIILAE
jgi:hypothetical protein